MGLLDAVLGGGKGDMMSTVLGLIGGQQGGLGGLVSQFASNGLGDIIGSWVGSGENKAISTDQIASALGADKIGEIASQLGTDSDSVLSQLTDILPKAIDKLTPDGAVPEGDMSDILSKGKDLLSGLF